MENSGSKTTPMATTTKLDKDEVGKSVDQKIYRGMIGSILYLTASRPDIMFSVCLCARYQSNPKESHLKSVKRILRYLKHTIDFSYFIPKHVNLNTYHIVMLILQDVRLIEKVLVEHVIF